MARVELLIVPDEGAGEVVRTALVEAGIPVEVERAYRANPFGGQVFAEPWRILVAEEQVAQAREVLARLEHEVAEELEAQAAAHALHSPLETDTTDPGSKRS